MLNPALIYQAIVETITNSTTEMSLKMSDCVNFSTCCHTEIICTLKDSIWNPKKIYIHTHTAASGEIYRRYIDFQSIQQSRTGEFECRRDGNNSASLLLVAHCAFNIHSNENCQSNEMLVRLNCQTQ